MEERKYSKFDEAVKTLYNNQEMPYDEHAWNKVEAKLNRFDAAKPKGKYNKLFVLAGALVASLAGIFALTQFNFGSDKEPIVKYNQRENISLVQSPDLSELNMPETRLENESEDNVAVEQLNTSESTPTQKNQTSLNEASVVVKENPESTGNPKENAPENIEPIAPVQNQQESKGKTNIELQFTQTQLCEGQLFKYRLKNAQASDVRWSVNGRNVESLDEHIHSVGKYKIQAIAKTGEKSNIANLEVHPLPVARFEYEEKMDEFGRQLVHLKAISTNATCFWRVGDENYTDSEINIPFSKKGTYAVRLQCTDAIGCLAVKEEFVRIDNDFNLMAPNAFSPNGDGINDTWMPKTLLNSSLTFNLEIQDKNGKVVFRSNDANSVWDGQIPDGTAQAGQLYFWKAQVSWPDNSRESFAGNITIYAR